MDPPAIPTAAAQTQTLKVVYNTAEIQTVVVRTQSTCMLTEPEPEIEKAEVMMQTEAEETTPVADVNTQTINAKLNDRYVQTVRIQLIDSQVQTLKPRMSHSQIQTDDVSAVLIDGF